MPPEEHRRPQLDRLARLLADGRGTEILMELLRLDLPAANTEQDGAQQDGAQQGRDLGPWRVDEHGALHRRAEHGGCTPCGVSGADRSDHPDWPEKINLADWADVEHVPAAGGATRVVLLGESAARGWPYDPALNCATALQRQLDLTGYYQCVDLAKVRASGADLVRLASRLPALRPEVVVAFAGNNIAAPPSQEQLRAETLDDPRVRGALVDAVRRRGYPGLREVLAAAAQDRCRRLLDQLRRLQCEHGARIVLVIPEFNLLGWTPEPGVEVPALPAATLVAWYALLADARRAEADQRWSELAALADKLGQLDEGTSPISGQLAAVAALALGEDAAARAALERSRDAACGLLLSCTPRPTRAVQDLMARHAAEHGWPCVDLRTVLAEPRRPLLPDRRLFHDYCHLSDAGIELAMAAVANVVLGRPTGSTARRSGPESGPRSQPGPGAPAPLRAFAHAHSAVHLAYLGQPAAVVGEHLAAALAADPGLAVPLAALRDLLAAPQPRWAHPATRALAAVAQIGTFLTALAQTGGLPAGLWTLRECLGQALGPEVTGDCTGRADLLAGPHCDGQPLPNYTPARRHHQATAQVSTLHFALDTARPATLRLTYRMADTPAGAAQVLVNGVALAALPVRPRWTDVTLQIPAALTRPGVNRVQLRWPVPAPASRETGATGRRENDAAALARGQFPYVLPIFGELFTALLITGEG